jgi:hypothetical protein
LFLAIAAIYFVTLSDAYFGLISDGKDMLYTAVSFHEFAEFGIGPVIDQTTGAVIQPDKYSKYGLGFSAVLQLPLVAAGSVERFFGMGRSNVLFPLTNMLITTATALVIAFCLKDLGARFGVSALAAWGFSIGTFAWPYISYDFSEPLQGLSVISAFWLLIRGARFRPPSPALIAMAGAVLGFAILTKAVLMILIPCFVYYLWAVLDGPRNSRVRYLLWFCIPLAAWMSVIAILNWYRFGSVIDFGYGEEATQFTTPLLTGLYGLLISPNKGLIFFAPLSLLLPWALWKMIEKPFRPEGIFALSLIALHTGVTAQWWSWEGGASWGPRLLWPVLPVIVVCAALLLEISKRLLVPFLLCGLAGFAVNLLGVLIFFAAWGQVVDLHEGRIPFGVAGRPTAEYMERDGRKWFLPSIATFYEPALNPIAGHAALLRSRYFDAPFPIRSLCNGTAVTVEAKSYGPIKIDLAKLQDPLTISQLCSARFWLWENWRYPAAAANRRPPLYAIFLEFQGERAMVQGKTERAIQTFKRAANLMPSVASPAVKLAALLLQANRRSEAEQTLTEFLSRNPADIRARFALASYYHATGAGARALEEYNRLLALRPDSVTEQMIAERIRSISNPGSN